MWSKTNECIEMVLFVSQVWKRWGSNTLNKWILSGNPKEHMLNYYFERKQWTCSQSMLSGLRTSTSEMLTSAVVSLSTILNCCQLCSFAKMETWYTYWPRAFVSRKIKSLKAGWIIYFVLLAFYVLSYAVIYALCKLYVEECHLGWQRVLKLPRNICRKMPHNMELYPK